MRKNWEYISYPGIWVNYKVQFTCIINIQLEYSYNFEYPNVPSRIVWIKGGFFFNRITQLMAIFLFSIPCICRDKMHDNIRQLITCTYGHKQTFYTYKRPSRSHLNNSPLLHLWRDLYQHKFSRWTFRHRLCSRTFSLHTILRLFWTD